MVTVTDKEKGYVNLDHPNTPIRFLGYIVSDLDTEIQRIEWTENELFIHYEEGLTQPYKFF